MADESRTIILGGGVSGLAAAYFLDGPSIVLEADDRPGGLCQSFSKDGFVYDIGGHILFSKNERVLGEMVGWLGDNAGQQRRANDIWYKDRFVKYPFENGLSVLPKEEIFEILRTYLERENGQVDNLEEWCYRRFGSGLAEKYLVPYNRKVWKREPRDMSVHWVERIPSPSLDEILKSAIGIETEGYTFQLNFHYPKTGGYESVIRSLRERVGEVRTGFRVTSIRRKGKTWRVSNGSETIEGDRLISTIPIFNLMPCLEGAPALVRDAVDALVYTSLMVHMIGVNHEGLGGKTATYFPSPDVLPHRICYMTGFSKNNAPAGCSHIISETSANPDDPILDAPDDVVLERIIGEVHEVAGFGKNEICVTDVKKIKYAYPVYDYDYQKKIDVIYRYLEDREIFFTGRFAAYRYINSDKCVEFAWNLANSLNAGKTPQWDWVHV